MNWTINEWRLQGSMCYYTDEWDMVIEYLRKGVAPIKEMITSKIKLGNLMKEGFDVLLKPGHNEIKIIVEPSE
jgi:threonine dehydrogenase-like Zn-dependent dehydrogenase